MFCVLFLDAQHRIIALKQMFRGTVTQTSVYPREGGQGGAVAECGGGDPWRTTIRRVPWSRAVPTSS